MAENWRNSGFVAKFLTKFAHFLTDEKGIFGGKILWSLTVKVSTFGFAKFIRV